MPGGEVGRTIAVIFPIQLVSTAPPVCKHEYHFATKKGPGENDHTGPILISFSFTLSASQW